MAASITIDDIPASGRYVVLRHTMPLGSSRPSHWDFMLETPVGLRTWALDQAPDGASPVEAAQLADHRAEYLTFEGPISGGRGSVERWDAGSFEREPAAIADRAGGQAESIALRLSGARLCGRAVLVPWRETPQRWRFSFAADPT